MKVQTIEFNLYRHLEPDHILIIIISNSNSNFISNSNNICNLYLGHDLVRYI